MTHAISAVAELSFVYFSYIPMTMSIAIIVFTVIHTAIFIIDQVIVLVFLCNITIQCAAKKYPLKLFAIF